MSNPERASERRTRRAAVSAARAGQGDRAAALLALNETEPVTETPPDTATSGQGIPTSNGQAVVTQQQYDELVNKYNKLAQTVSTLQRQAKQGFTQARRWVLQIDAENDKIDAAIQQDIEELQARLDKFADAFDEFHGKASAYESDMGTVFKTAEAVLSGYMEGINFGEEPANPQYLALGKALQGLSLSNQTPQVDMLLTVLGLWLQYSGYRNPLTADASASSSAGGGIG